MDKSIIFALLFIVFTGVAYYFWQEHEANLVLAGKKVEIPAQTNETLPATIEKKEIQYPVPEPAVSPVENNEIEVTTAVIAEAFLLPALNESDDIMQEVLARLYQPVRIAELFIFTDFVRHIVVSVDNLSGKKIPRRFVFTRSPATKFMINKSVVENELYMDSLNFGRYQRYIDFLNAVDNRQLVSVYIRYYPLFQEAYDELGYPGRYFNDRVIEVIDHLLQTPVVDEPVKLVQPKVYYQFADPGLEKLSAGQKLLIRVGHQNADQIKIRLQGLRQILTTLEP